MLWWLTCRLLTSQELSPGFLSAAYQPQQCTPTVIRQQVVPGTYYSGFIGQVICHEICVLIPQCGVPTATMLMVSSNAKHILWAQLSSLQPPPPQTKIPFKGDDRLP